MKVRTGLLQALTSALLVALPFVTGVVQLLGSKEATAQAPSTLCPPVAGLDQSIAQQHWQQAADLLKAFLTRKENCADASFLYGYVLMRADNPKDSLAAYTAAARLRQPNSDDFTAVASDYILLGAYKDAEQWLERAVHIAPVNSQAWYLLGRTQYNLDQNAAAVDSFLQNLRLHRGDLRSEYNLGLALERTQQLDQARAAYTRAIALDEQQDARDAQPYLDLGVLDRSEGNSAAALPLLQKAAMLSPNNPLIQQELGRVFETLGCLDKAILALQRAIQLAPNADPPHFFLGRIYSKAGRSTQAAIQFGLMQKGLGTKSSTATPNADCGSAGLRRCLTHLD